MNVGIGVRRGVEEEGRGWLQVAMCGKDAYGQAIRWGQIRITQTTTTNNKQKQNSFYIMGTRGTTVFANFLSVDRRGGG